MEDIIQRISKAFSSYYSQIKSKELTEEDFKLWIDSLSDPMRTDFKNKGLDRCRGVLNFQRFVLELQDNGLDDYFKKKLKEEDYNYWKGLSN